jgi:hypothetical protein
MSLNDCVNRAVRAGLMDPTRAQFARDIFNENYDQARLGLGDTEALARAREETLKIIRRQMAQLRREKLLQVAKARDILQRATSAGVPLERAMIAHLGFDPGVKGIPSVESRHKAIRGQLQSGMDEFLATFRRDLLGRNKNPALFAQMLDELHGTDTGSRPAKHLARAFTESAERARLMFNQAGGDIPRLDGWALPHSHDAIAVRAAGFDKWFADIRQGLDIEKMKDYRTGEPFTEQGLRAAAREAFDGISSEGWIGREAGGQFGQKLARRRLDHRFFIFRDAQSWSRYHNQYGAGDVFSVMMGHLDGMARDIAALQLLGPNPTATIRWMADVVEKDAMTEAARTGARTDAPETLARKTRRTLNTMWEHYTGSSNQPINGKVARTFAGTRSVLQSAQLGGAALSALADVGFQRMAAGQVGIPFNRVLRRHVSLLNPANMGDQKLAVRLGLIADSWSSLAVAQQRYLGEVSGPEITQRLADFTMRVSGLSPWTQAGRWAFGMEFSGLLAEQAGRTFDQLPEPLRNTMDRYGISRFDWDVARRADAYEHEGERFLRPEDIGEEEIAYKFLDMFHTETEFAVPSASLRGRAALIGESQPGTLQGELIRSFAMYKNFSVTLLMTHHRRLMSMPTAYEKGRYAAQLMLTMTLMGAFSMQVKEVAKGRDPRAMWDADNPDMMAKFWGAAALQGGGLGIFGDFLFSQENRYGGGLAQTIAGPVAGLGADVLGLLNENRTRLTEGEDTTLAAGAIDLAQRYMPGSSLWFARTAMENLVFDELRKLADPKAHERLRRIERKYQREYGQDYWYSRADNTMRAPDLSAMFGD